MFLMCPVGKESEFEALPHVTVDPYVAALWISGDRAELDEQGESVEANNPLRVGPSLIRAVDNLARMKRQAEAKARIVARLEEEAKRVSSEEDYEQAFHNAELKLAEAEKADNLAQRERLVREAQVFADIALVQSKARMTALKLDRNIADERASLSRLKTSLEVRENYLKSQFRELVASGYIPPRLSPEMQYLLGELDASEGKNEFED